MENILGHYVSSGKWKKEYVQTFHNKILKEKYWEKDWAALSILKSLKCKKDSV